MTPTRYLVDTSALVRLLRDASVRPRWELQITAGLIALCPIVELELLYTARSKADRENLLVLLRGAFAWAVMPGRVFERAAELQEALTQRGTHRSAGAVDLLIAATAELSGLTLLHHDHDFEEIVGVTGQRSTWLAQPGTID
jgi:predicted nucleic acid-binding protein